MRLKEDNSNWKSGGIIRRDFRHSHSEPEIPKASKKKPVGSKSLCPKRDDGHHDPVAIVERRCHLRDRDVEGQDANDEILSKMGFGDDQK